MPKTAPLKTQTYRDSSKPENDTSLTYLNKLRQKRFNLDLCHSPTAHAHTRLEQKDCSSKGKNGQQVRNPHGLRLSPFPVQLSRSNPCLSLTTFPNTQTHPISPATPTGPMM